MTQIMSLPNLEELGMAAAMPDVAKAIAEYERLQARHSGASADLHELLQARPAAIEADRTAYAAALRAGRDDPGEAALSKLNTRVTAASRKSEALALAVQSAAKDIADAVDKRRPELAYDVDEIIGRDHEALQEAVTRWEAARTTLAAHRALRGWIGSFPARTKFVPGATPPIGDLIGRNGDPISHSEIAAALRVDAEPQSGLILPSEPDPAAA